MPMKAITLLTCFIAVIFLTIHAEAQEKPVANNEIRLGYGVLTGPEMVNLFGIRIGKEIGAFMEWGFGFRGMVNVGISGKF